MSENKGMRYIYFVKNGTRKDVKCEYVRTTLAEVYNVCKDRTNQYKLHSCILHYDTILL